MHLHWSFVCLLSNTDLAFTTEEIISLTALHSSLVGSIMPGTRRRICVNSLQTCIRGVN